ncbi:hypothetical protein [Labrenzia sp. DG1229]|uniref:hypothetical protein n=1 Tax=Labrenzia sp. DG1229 TaxID=681847 RepID=UPI00048C8C36|nr:hypothetical protein [Labrenzia sp. DG1229]
MYARCITAEEVAERLQLAERTFRNKRRHLEEHHNFPPKMPGCNGWSEPAVTRWIETNGNGYLPAPDPVYGTTVDRRLIEDAAGNLAKEFGRTAA